MKRFRLITIGALVLAAGCSLVNTYDDIVPRVEGTYATGAEPSNDASAPDSATADATSDATDAGPPGSGGAIVVSATVEDDAGVESYVLSVLDPKDGRELSREKMVASAVRYDGLRDLWYIFESKTNDFVLAAGQPMVLHVRSLDVKTGAWTDLSQTPVPALEWYESIGVVNQRLGYVAYVDPEAGTGLQFVTINTASPSSISVINTLAIDINPVGVVATRSSTGAGGVISLVRTGVCDGSACPIELVPVRFPNGSTPIMDPPVQVSTTSKFAPASFAAMTAAERDLIITPRSSSDAAAPTFASTFDPQTHSQIGTTTTFFINDSAMRRAAISDCTNTAFVIGTNGDLFVHAVPIFEDGGGTATSAPTGHSGQSIYFEPTSKTVLVPFGQGSGHDFTAFRLGGTPDAPTLTKRLSPDWSPPNDLRPVLFGIRQPLPVTCN